MFLDQELGQSSVRYSHETGESLQHGAVLPGDVDGKTTKTNLPRVLPSPASVRQCGKPPDLGGAVPQVESQHQIRVLNWFYRSVTSLPTSNLWKEKLESNRREIKDEISAVMKRTM